MAESLHLSSRHREEIEALLHKHLPGVEVWAYGSRVNGRSHDGSDLDLVLRGPKLAEIDISRLADFTEALQDSTIPFLVEVRDWARLPESFHHEIEREHVVLVERAERDVADEWRESSLDDLLSFANGKSSPRRSNSLPHPVYGSNGIIGFSNEANAEKNTIIVGRVGSYCGSLYYSDRGCWVTDNAIRANAIDGHEARFLFFLLQTLRLNDRRAGSGQPLLNQTILSSIPVTVPLLPEQRAIAHILGTLDDKIELNRRMNETLEAMARALFKSWFVDFDPVRAKMEGRDTGLPQDLADLFPDRLVDSELGKIPEGWEVKTLAETVEIIGGGTPKTSVPHYWDGDIPWFSVVDAPVQSDIWVVDTAKKATQRGIENSSAQMLPVGTTIISARGTVGRIALVGVPMAMNQSCYGLRRNGQKNGLFNYFTIRALVVMLQQRTHGSVFDTITRDTLAAVYVVSPCPDVIDAYERLVWPAFERIHSGLFQSRNLVTIRDTLLPKLISGELRVKDATFVQSRHDVGKAEVRR